MLGELKDISNKPIIDMQDGGSWLPEELVKSTKEKHTNHLNWTDISPTQQVLCFAFAHLPVVVTVSHSLCRPVTIQGVAGKGRKDPLTKQFPDMKVVSGIVIERFTILNFERFTILSIERITIVNKPYVRVVNT